MQLICFEFPKHTDVWFWEDEKFYYARDYTSNAFKQGKTRNRNVCVRWKWKVWGLFCNIKYPLRAMMATG